MAKSKKKSSKSSKSKKVNKPSKVNIRTAGKDKQAKQPQVANSLPILAGVVLSFCLALVIGLLLIATAEDKGITSSAKPTTNPNSQQTIEVTEPTNTKGTPKPTGYNLQGSEQQGQQAEGGLQKPQTADKLQPNAKIKNYENAELN